MHQDISIVCQFDPEDMTVNLGDRIDKFRFQFLQQLLIFRFQPPSLSHQLALHLICFQNPLPITFLMPFSLSLFDRPAPLGFYLSLRRIDDLIGLHPGLIEYSLSLGPDLFQIRNLLFYRFDDLAGIIAGVPQQDIYLFSAEAAYESGLLVTIFCLHPSLGSSDSLQLADPFLNQRI